VKNLTAAVAEDFAEGAEEYPLSVPLQILSDLCG